MAAIDPTKVGKYPVILSPELLGKPSTETYTGIRYNHKPTLSSDTAPDTAFLKKSAQAGTFNLGFKDNGAQYQYKGVRTTDDGNYVLIFDPKRQAFVLHRVDSMFHMNLVRTPNEGIESLRKKFPQLEIKNEGATASKPSLKNSADEKKSAANGSANKKSVSFKDGPKVPAPRKAAPLKAPVRAPKGKGKAALAERKAPVSITLPDPNAKPKVSLPMPALPAKKAPEPEKKPNKKRTNSDEEDSEDDDDDFGFTIEYPDADPRHVQDRSFPPPTSLERRFSEADFGAGSGSNDAAELDWSAFERERDRRNNAMDVDDDDDEEEFVDALRKKDEDVRLMPPPPRPLPRAPPVQATPKPPVNEPEVYTFDVASSDEDDADADANAEQQQDDDAGDDFDLEAELEAAFDKVEGGEEDPGGDSDSSVSEEE